ncbi:hypothetical protein B0H13DRAFT_1558540, partial [Mycena leptocephala]
RELEMLNEITYLRYNNKLPLNVKGVNRRALLRSFQLEKGSFYEPEGLDPHVKWRKGDEPLLLSETYQGQWTLVGEDVKSKDKQSPQTKRKATSQI